VSVLIEVMPKRHFGTFHLWLVHLGKRYITRPVRVFERRKAENVGHPPHELRRRTNYSVEAAGTDAKRTISI